MPQDLLTRAKECWKEAQEANRENRERMLEDLRFSNPACPEQWDDAVKRLREQSEGGARPCLVFDQTRSEEHTSELQSLMRISYAVFCLKKKKPYNTERTTHH